VLKGEVQDKAHRDAAAKIASSWAKEVVNLIEVIEREAPKKPLDIEEVGAKIRRIDGLQGVSLTSIGDTLILKGRVRSEKEKEACARIVTQWAKEVVNLIEVIEREAPKKPLDIEEVGAKIRRIDGLQGVSLTSIGDTLILKGRVRSEKEKEACARIVTQWAKEVVNLIEVETSPPPPPYEGISKVEGLEGVSFTIMGENLVLRGKVEDHKDKEKAETLAKALYPKVINLIEVDSPIQVLVKLQLVEIKRDALRKLGVDWSILHEDEDETTTLSLTKPDPFEDTFKVGIVRTSLGRIQRVEMTLSLLQKKGYLEVLSSPTLVTRNGKEAYVNMGGKIPIPVVTIDPTGSRTTAIEWVEYGIQMRITPQVNRLGNIDLLIDSGVSDIDWENAVKGYPALLEKRVTTRISAQSGDTIIISGLIDTSKTRIAKKVPYLGDIPIIGTLFRTKETREEETELVVLITPEIVSPQDFEEVKEEHPAQREVERAKRLRGEVLPPSEREPLPKCSAPEVLEQVVEKVALVEEKRVSEPEDKRLMLVVHPYPYPDGIGFHVALKNLGENRLYVGPTNFLLKTKDGTTHRYSPKTYTTPSPFFGKVIGSDEEVSGLLLFETDESPQTLIYSDPNGNNLHWDF
jgi:pilus assembly protein CpaC